MNKRLAWNFEIKANQTLDIPQHVEDAVEDSHWEFRQFWPEENIIVLSGLDVNFLELSRYKIKHRNDEYMLVANMDLNLKHRGEELIYKPTIKRTAKAVLYGKKIKFPEHPNFSISINEQELDAQTFLKTIYQEHQNIVVEKEALIYKFDMHRATKLELARLNIQNKIFFTLCVESPSLKLVEHLSNQIIASPNNMDYVTFFKNKNGSL